MSHMRKLYAIEVMVFYWMCSDGKCPLSSATNEDRRNRADIAASFQVEKSICGINLLVKLISL